MRAVVQRVTNASVNVDGEIVGRINEGLLIFLAVGDADDDKDFEYILDKVVGLRIFQDDNDKMNLSIMDIKGELLIVSQFTLYGDARKGKRASLSKSGNPELGEKYDNELINRTKELGIKTESGVFGAHMNISLINNGPVTILLDSKKSF